MKECYFVIDDVINESGREGFEVMYGHPGTAIGVSEAKFRTLREARAYVLKHDVLSGRDACRVFLARRHGAHKVVALFPVTDERPEPFRENGVWQARGFTAFETHFNRAFRTKREAEKFIGAMMRGDLSVDRY